MTPAKDALARPLRDFRLSVTDRCNFRCGYCLPRDKTTEGSFLPKSQVLSYEEMVTVCRAVVGLGVSKIRITGGEPLLRRDLTTLIRELSHLGVELALTTNGSLLASHAADLKAAGLHRLTVSLDALDPALFDLLADAPGQNPGKILAGITAASEAGFERIKVNCVVKRSANLSEVLPLVRKFHGTGVVLRFIEFMDVGNMNRWSQREVVPEAELRALLAAHGTLEDLPRTVGSETARRALWNGSEVGFVSSVSVPFCGACSRLRMSAEGKFYTCLFASHGLDLRPVLRGAKTLAEAELLVREELRKLWLARTDRYSEQRASAPPEQTNRSLPVVTASRVEMARVGG